MRCGPAIPGGAVVAESFGFGRRVAKIRIGLAGEKPAQRPKGIAHPRDQRVVDARQTILTGRAKVVGPLEVDFKKGARLSPSCRRPCLDVEPRFLRAFEKYAIAARALDINRYQIAGSRIAGHGAAAELERLCLEIAVDFGGDTGHAVGRPVLQVVNQGFIDKPADTYRCLGSRDQERTRKAAGERRSRHRRCADLADAGARAGRLGQLIDPRLEQLLLLVEHCLLRTERGLIGP
ncbi:MAG TPA: hypothetical protein VL985_20545 [Stellaceae bacterium]|nr:hypothetical protein [Stellaceae bacterium]